MNVHDHFSLGLHDLAKKLKVSATKLRHLILIDKLQDDPDCFRTIRVGKSPPFKRYSPKALDHLHKRLAEIDLDELWAKRKAAA